jgi:hypothetical protein
MFGHRWEPATAKVVARKYKESSGTSGVYEYVVDVTPASGATFRAPLKQPMLMSHVVMLGEGAVVRVFADVKGQKVKFDTSDPQVSGKGEDLSGKSGYDAALAQPPGSPPPGEQS